MTKDKSRIQSCVDHINTAVDVDPWAKELVAEMGKEMLKAQLSKEDATSDLQQTCNQLATDCISRQAAIDAVDKLSDKPIDYLESAIDVLVDLPSVHPEPQWIPVTERLPEDGGYYIVTENISEDGDKWVGLRWYSTVNGWEFEPVAWMQLPKPYQEEGE